MASKANIIFSFESKDISIQCLKNTKIKDICKVYAHKIGHDMKTLSFLYGGNKINLELSFEELALPIDKANNQMKIIVSKKEEEKNFCPFCNVKTSLKTKEIEIITSSNNAIKKGINDIQNYIQKLMNNCYIYSISYQLHNVSYMLNSISEQLEKYNKNLQKSLKNIAKFDNSKIDEKNVNLKNDKIDKENNGNKEKELYEKQQKELELKKKLEQEEKEEKNKELMQKRLKEEEDKNKIEQKKLEEENKKKTELMKQQENLRIKEQLKIQKKQFENEKLEQEQFTMSTPDFGYACTCTNLMILVQYIYVGTNIAEIPLMLKNEGAFAWPKNLTKLVFEKKYPIKGKDVELNSLNPGQEQKFIVKIEGLGNLPEGEYKAGVYFNIRGSNCGNMMKMKIIIIKKEVDPKIKYKNEIKRFRDEYNLTEVGYSDDELYEILESHNFNFEEAFKCIAGGF